MIKNRTKFPQKKAQMYQLMQEMPKKYSVTALVRMEDADGISSAALIKQAFGGDTALVDYPGMTDVLETLRNDEKLKTLFICDLGLNKQNTDYFVELLTELRKKQISITYIDHHHLDSKIIAKLKKVKVKLIHNTSECTSVLIYDAFKKKLSDHSVFIAACGASTDYMICRLACLAKPMLAYQHFFQQQLKTSRLR